MSTQLPLDRSSYHPSSHHHRHRGGAFCGNYSESGHTALNNGGKKGSNIWGAPRTEPADHESLRSGNLGHHVSISLILVELSVDDVLPPGQTSLLTRKNLFFYQIFCIDEIRVAWLPRTSSKKSRAWLLAFATRAKCPATTSVTSLFVSWLTHRVQPLESGPMCSGGYPLAD
ncbi:uncharacterized protein BO72DRAFT_137801 [Aspergillus fijiensis CBS 313.89]|uniref:Uncharacterized protein n=1 Tax=Aspergillus fijiensis CBS 313.89 TaxID=1448319 RepID=A0A8G1W2G7_9EURO|nr:uncharacterized protein BO72DRAFT_137801 [Aspergillus fijiensis CBS 313.89]RAK82005.1 hypothetical protein BO72DRAFT_137801 [Aspergillus fijiensis CBS 313.89]